MSWFRRKFRESQLRAEGVPQQRAARQPRLSLRNAGLGTETSVKATPFRFLESLWLDLRLALHQSFKAPGYALTAVLTLAIGIGANAAIFAIIDDAMLRSLPVERPQELVQLLSHGCAPAPPSGG